MQELREFTPLGEGVTRAGRALPNLQVRGCRSEVTNGLALANFVFGFENPHFEAEADALVFPEKMASVSSFRTSHP